jgi:hypothetical protein
VVWVAADPKRDGFVVGKTVVDRSQVKSVLTRYGVKSQPFPTKKVTHIIVPNHGGADVVGDGVRQKVAAKTPVLTLEKFFETYIKAAIGDKSLRAFLAEENVLRAQRLEEKQAAKAQAKKNKKKNMATSETPDDDDSVGASGGGGGKKGDKKAGGAHDEKPRESSGGAGGDSERPETQVLHTNSPFLYIGDAEFTAHAKSQLSSSFDDWGEFCRHVSATKPSHTFTGDEPDKNVAYISNAGTKRNTYTIVRRSDAKGNLIEINIKLNRPASASASSSSSSSSSSSTPSPSRSKR